MKNISAKTVSTFISIAVLASLSFACVKLPEAPNRSCKRLMTGDGPEDFALDTYSGPARLLISSHERRKWSDPGEIHALDLATGTSRVLPRVNEPAGISFRPHGVDLVKTPAGETLLYVITHGPERDDDRHAIEVYRVEPGRLIHVKTLASDLLVSPNDLDALPDGSLFVGNDSGTRGSFIEMALGLRRSNVLRYDGAGGWSVAARDIAFANGILARPDGGLIVSASTGDRIIAFKPGPEGSFVEDRTIAEMTVPDNLIALSGEEFLVATHPDGLAFMAHAKDKTKLSPALIYRVNITSGDKTPVYANDGTELSAPSTALVHGGKLYIAQVFEPFVLECDAEDIAR